MVEIAALVSVPQGDDTTMSAIELRAAQAADEMPPGTLKGLVVSAVLKCLTDPNDVKAFVQIWTDDGVSDAEALVRVVPANKLGDGVVVDAWTVREHVFKRPVERQSGGGCRAA